MRSDAFHPPGSSNGRTRSRSPVGRLLGDDRLDRVGVPTTAHLQMNREKLPLYRKVNTTARTPHSQRGGQFAWDRNTKRTEVLAESGRLPMQKSKNRWAQGFDYTPLFRFLLSRVGKEWQATYTEAKARLDKEDPIWWIVRRPELDDHYAVNTTRLRRVGESSYYTGLHVVDGVLEIEDKTVGPKDVQNSIYCLCCTYTLNGAVVGRPEGMAQWAFGLPEKNK
jgi:hypothetical protein